MKLVLESRQLQVWKANLFYVGLLTLVTSVMWIFLGVYFKFSQSTIDVGMEKLIKPLNPVLDVEKIAEFASTRSAPPETFVITAVEEDESGAPTTLTINPFDDTEPIRPNLASESSIPN